MKKNSRIWMRDIFYVIILVMIAHMAVAANLESPGPGGQKPASAASLLTVNFYESDIRQVFLGLGIAQNINIVMSPEVTGKVTIHLDSATLDEAIFSIAMAGGFSYQKEKGVYFVYKPAAKLDSQASRLQVKVFKLKFAKTDKVQEILTAIPGIRIVRIHEDTKTVIVEDTPENLAKIETVINVWDAPPKQVLIETTMLEVQLTDDMKLGVDWTAVLGASVRKAIGSTTITTGKNFSASAGGGVTATIQSYVGTPQEFSTAIQALQSITKVNTLSTPKILAVHGKPARVQVGGKQGYKTIASSAGGVITESIQFLDTGTILEITAFISDENNILLNVQPQQSTVTIDAKTNIPTVATTNVATSLLAKSGQTVFIGGLIKDSLTNTRTMIPLLGHIPVLGTLFGYSNPSVQKNELVVLITPRILEEDLDEANAEAAKKVEQVNERNKKTPTTVYKEFLNN